MQKFKKALLSEVMLNSSNTQRIAYVAIMTALCVVCNMFFEFKLADTQFSLTICFSALTGLIIGPIYGFIACFLGDLVGFLYHSAGFAYMPWIGISLGLTSMIAGLIVNGLPSKRPWFLYVKLALVCLLTGSFCPVRQHLGISL